MSMSLKHWPLVRWYVNFQWVIYGIIDTKSNCNFEQDHYLNYESIFNRVIFTGLLVCFSGTDHFVVHLCELFFFGFLDCTYPRTPQLVFEEHEQN